MDDFATNEGASAFNWSEVDRGIHRCDMKLDREVLSARGLTFGASVIGPERTLFRLWAPAAPKVDLEIEGCEPIRMTAAPDGWYEAEAACGAGAEYRFRISDDLAVVDPAARFTRSGPHGTGVVVDPLAYKWRNSDWKGRPWSETIFYELHVGAFDGFAGVADALPKLAELGVTAIELMPISAFPGRFNWGYDGVLPYAPDESYGTPNDLKALVDRAHDLGLMIFLDVVYNHFGPSGNFIGAYAPLFFREDVHTAWGGAIDFRQPEVRRFYSENALYWLNEFRFDGLRFDAAHAIADPDWLDDTAKFVRERIDPTRQFHLVLENDDNVAAHMRNGCFNAQWNDDGHHVLHALLTGETEGYYSAYAEEPAKKLARALSEGFIYQGEPFVSRNGELRGTLSGDLSPAAFVFFLQNHDQIGNRALGDRLTSLAHSDALEAAIVLQFLCPHIPLMFMGEENASQTPFLYFAEHEQSLAESILEGRKKEFEVIATAGHALPDPNDMSTYHQSIPTPGENAEHRFALYRKLIELRREHIAPAIEGSVSLGATVLGAAAVSAKWRLGDGRALTIVVNLGGLDVVCDKLEGGLLFESRDGAAEAIEGGSAVARSTVVYLGNQ